MFNIADILVLVVIALTTFIGYKRGFIKTAFGFLSFFIAIALTFMLYKPVMGLIKEKTGFESWLSGYLYNMKVEKETDNEEESIEGSYLDNIPDSVVELIGINEIKENAKNIIIQKIVDFAVKLLAIVAVYIAARIILLIITIVLDLVFKLPVLKQFNETLGLVLGIVLGFIRVYAIFMIITLLGSLPATSGIVEIINNSLFASILYNNNILLKIIF